MTVAFVLAGGGSLAASQVGMLRALTEAGIRADLVVGSSAGAINAYCYAEHPTEAGLDRLSRLWCGLRRRDVFPLRLDHIFGGLIGRRDGVVPPDRLRDQLERHVGPADLADARVPTHLVATDLAAGEPVVFSSGSALEALMASTAMPGVFPPVRIADRQYIDGGGTADTPIRQAEDAGATITYVLPSVGAERPRTLHGALPVLMHAIGHVFGHAVATDVAGARGEVHVLPAPAQGRANPFDFRATARLIDEGYAAAKTALARVSHSESVHLPTHTGIRCDMSDDQRGRATVAPYPDGPLLLRADFELCEPDGTPVHIDQATVALCRCGKSAVKPFCDGTHKVAKFQS